MNYIQKIEAELRNRELTAKKMLLDLGYSDNLLSQWKKGSEPSAFKLQRIATYLELSLDYLLMEPSSHDGRLVAAYHTTDDGIRRAVDKLLDIQTV